MKILAQIFIALQLILNLILIFWYFFLVWKTFPFRYGLLKKLILEEFPVLLIVPINFILFVAERILRLYYLTWTKEVRSNVVTIYVNPVYMPVFAVKNVFAVVMYAFSIKAAIEIGHPKFYKPAKWLQV